MDDDQVEKQIILNIQRPLLTQDAFDAQYGYHEPPVDYLGPFKDFKQKLFTGEYWLQVLRETIPIIVWLPKLKARDIITDVLNGFTLGLLCVPQAMAYAALANVNTVVGLYTSLFPTLIYAIFGTSKHITIGMFAVVALMAGNAIDREMHSAQWSSDSGNSTFTMTGVHPEQFSVQLISSLTLTVGIILAIMALLQLHFATAFLSDPAVGGFITASACHVLASQLSKLIGVTIKQTQGFLKLPFYLLAFSQSVYEANLCTIIISVFSIAVLMIGKYLINPALHRFVRYSVPFELIVIVTSVLVTSSLQLDIKHGIAVVGYIPQRLPTPSIPEARFILPFLVDALLIAFVIFSVTVSVGKVFAKKHNYQISPKQELRVLALVELVGSMLSCHPASGSLARAAVNSEMGTNSQIGSMIAASLVLLVILLIGPLLYYLPMAVLASIIVVALQGMLMRVTDIVKYWRVSKIDLLIWLVSFLSTFLWNVGEGLAIAICFSILTVIVRTQWPGKVILGSIRDTELYKDSNRYSSSVVAANIAIYRYDAPLLFLNSEFFIKNALKIIDRKIKSLAENANKFLIIDASGFTYIDYTGVESLIDLQNELERRKVDMLIASAKAPARLLFKRCDIVLKIPSNRFFPSLHDAVVFAKAHSLVKKLDQNDD